MDVDVIPKSIGGALVLVLASSWLSGPAPALGQSLSSRQSVLRLPAPTGAAGFGAAVAGLDDADDDGIPDVVVTSPGSHHVYVASGASGSIVHDIAAPSATGGTFGAAIAAVGDVDLDGGADFAVSAPSRPAILQGSAGGRVFLFSGRSGAMLRELVPSTTGAPDFGRSVSGPGDVSGDGVPDVVVGGGGGPGGTVSAYSGASGGELWSRADVDTSFGQLVVATPDVSGDNVADVLVSTVPGDAGGQPPASAGSVTDLLAGVLNGVLGSVPARVQVLSGATGAVLRSISAPAPTHDQTFGGTLAAVGDQDGDGVVDHLIGERGANRLHLHSGDDGMLIRSFAVPPHALGHGISALAPVDDQDGDGRDDIWIGIGSVRGAYLVNGTGAVLAQVPPPSPHGSFGTSIATVGKIPGDPTSDVVVGDPTEPGGGAAYLLRSGRRAMAAAETHRAAVCDGAGCQALLRTGSQSEAQTPTSTSTVPATATLPKPAGSAADASALPSTGGQDRSAAGLWAAALGLAGIALLRRPHHPMVNRRTSAAGEADV